MSPVSHDLEHEGSAINAWGGESEEGEGGVLTMNLDPKRPNIAGDMRGHAEPLARIRLAHGGHTSSGEAGPSSGGGGGVERCCSDQLWTRGASDAAWCGPLCMHAGLIMTFVSFANQAMKWRCMPVLIEILGMLSACCVTRLICHWLSAWH